MREKNTSKLRNFALIISLSTIKKYIQCNQFKTKNYKTQK